MKRMMAATLMALTFGIAAPAFAAPTEDQCNETYVKLDANNNGWIEGAEAKPYIDALKKGGHMADDANPDGKLNADEFVAACVADHFKDVAAQ